MIWIAIGTQNDSCKVGAEFLKAIEINFKLQIVNET